jgi:tRNA pseudouridine55 synthase
MSVPRRTPRRKVDGILLLDKPLGLSSNDALQRAKRLFNADKAGHTGSLDPLATGMLPICFGEATKLSGVLLESEKTYHARVGLGTQTSTGDAEGDAIARSDPSGLTAAALVAAIEHFRGSQQQVPPMYSALKREGRPLYELAREGQVIEREPRQIVVSELVLLSFSGTEFEIHVRCSKGTYIRTLAEDIADAVGQRAHLLGLRRTGVAPFWDRPPTQLADLDAAAGRFDVLDRSLLQPADALRHWPCARLNDVQALAFRQGRQLRLAGVERDTRLAVTDTSGTLLGIAHSDGDGWVQPQRCLAAPP